MYITEENFLEELRNKNEKALEYIIDEYGWVISSIVRKKLYNLQNYQDECINDILLGIWNNSQCFKPEKNSFKNWIAGISKYKCIDYQRKYLKNIAYEDIDTLELNEDDNTHNNIIQQETMAEINDLLSNLKDQDKKLFLAIYYDQCKISDLSDQTGIKESVIYNRISRAKKKLRKLFHTV